MGRDSIHQPYELADGRRVPSVTGIIGANLGWGKQQMFGWIRKKAMEGIDPNRIRDFAGEIGTVAHGLIEEYFTGEPFNIYEYPADAIAAARIAYQGFEAFAATHELECVHSEIPVVHEELEYGGTLDWVGKINGEMVLLDFKTSNNIYLSHRIQQAAYMELYRHKFGVELKRSYLLHLDKHTGGYHLYCFNDVSKEWEVFLLCLRLHQLHKELGDD